MRDDRVAGVQTCADPTFDGAILIDARGVVLMFNPACERLFGYFADEVIGKNVKMLMPEPYRHEHDGYIAKDRKSVEYGKSGDLGGRRIIQKKKCSVHIEL